MTFGGKKASLLLFAGDIFVFVFSLWVSLSLRAVELPSYSLFIKHLVPFSALFALWILIFYMSGLYGKRVILFSRELPGTLVQTQLFNVFLAVLFFFLFPFFGITPKTVLVIYLLVSLGVIYVWRLRLFPAFTVRTERYRAALIGSGIEANELVAEVGSNERYHLVFPLIIDPAELKEMGHDAFFKKLAAQSISMIVVDTENDLLRPLLPLIYEACFIRKQYQFVDFYRIYEEIFDRVPLSLLQYDWFLKNVSYPAQGVYALTRRAVDVVGGVLMGVVTAALLPFVALAMKIEGPGPLFIVQDRIGRYGARMKAYKFRSMSFSDKGAWAGESINRVTRVGRILRLTSLDEFPQFINILRGELSLIGPRNDIEALGSRLAEAMPFYNIRYIVKPGITGWAQINQKYEQGHISPQSIEETKVRLAYDFYYIKNRSLALDIVIALKTVKRMFFRVGSW